MVFYSGLPSDLAFPGSTVIKNLPAKAGDMRCGFDSWVRKIPWRRKWRPAPVFLQGNCMDKAALWATVHGATKSQT